MSVYRFSNNEIPQFFQSADRILRHSAMDVLAKPRVYSRARLLVVTPRKVGRAVDRNKIRRRLKHIFYEQGKFKNLYDYIIVAKGPAIDLSFNQLKELLCSTIERHEHTPAS